MASATPGEKLKLDASCLICLDFLSDPVSVDCGHSFCRRCISDFCEQSESGPGGSYPCPHCRAPFGPGGFRPNRQLASVVDGIRRLDLSPGAEGGRATCEEHGEPLGLFCRRDRRLLCRLCQRSPEHRDHSTAPLEEAAEVYKFRAALARVRRELEKGLDLEASVGKKTVLWKDKVEARRRRVVLEFEKQRGFLASEEQLQLRRLEEEERETLRRLRESRARLAQRNRSLRDRVGELEERCRSSALALLRVSPARTSRSEATATTPPEAISTDLRTTCSIPGLREMLNRFRVDVTLDPATAHPALVLGDDLKSVRDGDVWEEVPDTADRFDTWPCVLGRECFRSGRRYWEVGMESQTEWGLGVCRESALRKGEASQSPENGVWAVWLLKGNGYMVLSSSSDPVIQERRPERMGIYLDYEGGEISFYNVTAGAHVYTFAQSFSGPLRPYFFVCDPAPLTLPPVVSGES
uniref:Tripartite motif containing 58 n=1 Tax=Ornithorhynchus anatinus TaxID=9258 RepID=F7BJ36_ORNAN